jgi:threonine dehydrogenase-like Zn-dependent dehydrogenase
MSTKFAIVGVKKLGLLIVVALHVLGYKHVYVAGRNETALKMCKALGVREIGGESEFDVVFDCSGNSQGFELAAKLTRHNGVVHLKSTGGQPVGEVSHLTQLVVDEVAILCNNDLNWHWETQLERKNSVLHFNSNCANVKHNDNNNRADVVVVSEFSDIDIVYKLGLVRVRGAIIVDHKATSKSEAWALVASKQLQVHTSRCGDIEHALSLLEQCDDSVKDILLHQFVTHVCQDFNDAMMHAKSDPTAIKVLLEHKH